MIDLRMKHSIYQGINDAAFNATRSINRFPWTFVKFKNSEIHND